MAAISTPSIAQAATRQRKPRLHGGPSSGYAPFPGSAISQGPASKPPLVNVAEAATNLLVESIVVDGPRVHAARPFWPATGPGNYLVCSGLEFSRRVGIDFAAYCDYFEIGARPIHFIPPLLDSEAPACVDATSPPGPCSRHRRLAGRSRRLSSYCMPGKANTITASPDLFALPSFGLPPKALAINSRPFTM